MQEVVCFNCGRIVDISPDAELCSVCGENLRELIHPAYISKYFYDRAAAMAAADELLQALREIDRGLTYHESSELRLLGAILSQRIGDFAQMRHHVAAVPVHDVLRPEAEWLLRSHQTRQRVQRTGGKDPSEKVPSLAELDPLPPLPSARHDSTDSGIRQQRAAQNATSATLVAQEATPFTTDPYIAEQPHTPAVADFSLIYLGSGVLALIVAGVIFVMSTFFPDAIATAMPWLPLFSTANQTPSATDLRGGPAETVHQPNSTTFDTGASFDDGRMNDSSTDVNSILQPTPSPTVDLLVPPDVVIETLEPLADSTPNRLEIPLQPYELTQYLADINRPELAALAVSASSQEGTILLKGIVPSFQARQELLAVMEQAPGVTRVSGADLLIRLPPTYTVQAGDTLWAISARFYGEARVNELLAANQDVLASADALRVGMDLKLPLMEE